MSFILEKKPIDLITVLDAILVGRKNAFKWVVPENIRTPTTGGILEFQMHGGFFGLEFRMHRGLLGLEFQMHEGVSSPGILKRGGGGLKTLIY